MFAKATETNSLISSSTPPPSAIPQLTVAHAAAQFDTDQSLPEYTIGTYINALPVQRDDPPPPFACPLMTAGLRCADDCRTRALCTGAAEPVVMQTCASIDALRPYCVDNACTANANASDPACSTAFVCTASGTFPDPIDCTLGHSCSGLGATSQQIKCPDRYVFDVRELKCRRRDSPRQCQRIDCARLPRTVEGGDVVVYAANPAYYAFCVTGAKSQTVVFRCADVDNEVYSADDGRCAFQCKRPGNFADRTDCNAYQVCERRQGRLRATKVRCPENYFFANGACVPEAATAKCVPERTL